MKRRLAELPLHSGKAPAWLFRRMTQLAGAVTMAIVEEFGPAEMLQRLADPWWFQAFGCVLGFDWHSSGVTTVTCGALKEAAKLYGRDFGLLVAGGKGGTSRKTPQEIATAADQHAISGGDQLIYASRMSAKVDSAAVQDGFQLYHHAFFFTPGGQWCVVQQGLNDETGWARRYHWLGDSVDDFVCEPHAAIQDLGGTPGTARRSAGSGNVERSGPSSEFGPAGVGQHARRAPRFSEEQRSPGTASPRSAEKPRAVRGRSDTSRKNRSARSAGLRQLELFGPVESEPGPRAPEPESPSGSPRVPAAAPAATAELLNMVAAEAAANRSASAALIREQPDWLLGEIERCTAGPTLFAPARHPVLHLDVNLQRLNQLLVAAHEQHPQDFQTLLGLPGVGPATIRSLSLLAEIIFQAPASHRDPATPLTEASPGPHSEADEPRRWADYSYAHGGKDGTPFPVDRGTYDRNIFVLTDAVRRARLGDNDKFDALRRLGKLTDT